MSPGIAAAISCKGVQKAMSRRDTVVVFFFCMLCASNASAYLDPNAGGMIFQMVAPVIVAIVGWSALIKRKVQSGLMRFLSVFQKKSNTERQPPAN